MFWIYAQMFNQGIQATEKALWEQRKSNKNQATSPRTLKAQDSLSSDSPVISSSYLTAEGIHVLWDPSSDLVDPLLDDYSENIRCARTAALGNLLLTVVHQSGVFEMEVLYCICPNAGQKDEQLLQSGMFPSSFKQIETVFTFSVLDEFLTDNLECKTTAQQYFSKLQSITNRIFPHTVPVCFNCLPMWCDICPCSLS